MKLSRRFNFTCHLTVLTIGLLAGSSLAAELPDQLPDPDGKEADMSKPVQVFILLGQSNMLGAGKIGPADKDGSLEHAVKEKGKYPYRATFDIKPLLWVQRPSRIRSREAVYHDKWTWFYGARPVFAHPPGDRDSFRMFSAQLVCQGACKQVEIVKAFGVSAISVKRIAYRRTAASWAAACP